MRQNEPISAEPFLRLSEAGYYRLVQVVIDDVTVQRPRAVCSPMSAHELAFARYAVLVTSVLGGFCWMQAPQEICQQTFERVQVLVDGGEGKNYILTLRKGVMYPIFVAPIVRYAALLLIVRRMAVNPIRRTSLSRLEPQDILAPNRPGSRSLKASHHSEYRLGVIEQYLSEVASLAGLARPPSLDDYLAIGRYLMTLIYDLDVLYATLGSIETGVPTSEQLGETQLLHALSCSGPSPTSSSE